MNISVARLLNGKKCNNAGVCISLLQPDSLPTAKQTVCLNCICAPPMCGFIAQ